MVDPTLAKICISLLIDHLEAAMEWSMYLAVAAVALKGVSPLMEE